MNKIYFVLGSLVALTAVACSAAESDDVSEESQAATAGGGGQVPVPCVLDQAGYSKFCKVGSIKYSHATTGVVGVEYPEGTGVPSSTQLPNCAGGAKAEVIGSQTCTVGGGSNY